MIKNILNWFRYSPVLKEQTLLNPMLSEGDGSVHEPMFQEALWTEHLVQEPPMMTLHLAVMNLASSLLAMVTKVSL